MLAKSAFQPIHLVWPAIKEAGLLLDRAGLTEEYNLTGTWPLPKYGPREIEASKARHVDTIQRSIVERLPVVMLIRVPRSFGVA